MQKTWQMVRRVVTVVLVVVAFSLVMDLVHAYEVLRGISRWLGWLYLVALVALVVWAVVAYVRNWLHYPPVAVPPPSCDLAAASRTQLCHHARYRRRVLLRLTQNENLPEEMRERLNRHAGHLGAALAQEQSTGTIYDALQDAAGDVLEPAMRVLDQFAEREVQRCVRDVMLGVTLSPWRSVDLGVVIYRNASMVLRVAAIYHSRPRMLEQLMVLRDVTAVVATVNFLNYGSRLLQNLAGSVPVLGRFADDLAQGVGAGLLTSMAGHAAVSRCRGYQGWDAEIAQETLRGKLVTFAGDVKGIVLSDLMPALRRPVEAQAEPATREPDWFDKVRDATGRAIDETSSCMDTFIRRPAVAAGRGVWQTGSRVMDLVALRASAGWRGVRRGASRMRDATGEGVRRGSKRVSAAAGSTADAARRGFSRARQAGGKMVDRLHRKPKPGSDDVTVDGGPGGPTDAADATGDAETGENDRP